MGRSIPIIITIIIIFSLASYERNTIWGNSIVLYEEGIRKSPLKSRAHVNLCTEYLKIKLYDKALDHCLTSLRLKPYLNTYYNLGVIYYKIRNFNEALKYLLIALRIEPDNEKTHKVISNVYAEIGFTDRAIGHYKTAIRLNPDFAEAHFDLGLVYISNGYIEKGIEELKATLNINPEHQEARRFLNYLVNIKG